MKKKSYLPLCLITGLVSAVIAGFYLPPFPHTKKKPTRIQAVNTTRPTPEWLRMMRGTNPPAENKPAAAPYKF